uniref:steroidogenic acute regulatory protein, mitochondrial n=1 Tax=Myxine glutinosa TaxID=7769 RepID=UPI00358FBDBF
MIKNTVQQRIVGQLSRLPEELLGSLGQYKTKDRSLPGPRLSGDPAEVLLSECELRYVQEGQNILQKTIHILEDHSGWHCESKTDNGDKVSSKVVPNVGKMFRLEAEIPGSVEELHKELFDRVEHMCEWNPNVNQVKVLQRVGQRTLVTHDMAADAGGKLLSARDFVNLRQSVRRGSVSFLVGVSTDCESAPPQNGYIRGETGPSLIMLRPSTNDVNNTRIVWLLNIDLKGWIPKSIINLALSRMQINFAESLRARMSSIHCGN